MPPQHEGPAAAPGEVPQLTVDSPYEIANWRPLVQWILTIPHYIILWVLQYVAGVVAIIIWFAVLFTGRIPPGLYNFMGMYVRYYARTVGFLYGFSEQYPPFEFPTGPRDDLGYRPIRVDLPEVPPETSRKALANFLLAIPHYIVLWIFGIGVAIVAIIAWFAVLFTGRWPQGMRDFLVSYGNYLLRVWTYVIMVDTDYPEFGLK